MASSCPSPHHARLSIERRPKLLKDFLQDQDHLSNFHGSKFSSKHITTTSNTSSLHLLRRSRSSRAATATISAIHKVINIVKFLPFTSVKSPSILPRSISRKLSRRSNNNSNNNNNAYKVNQTSYTLDVPVKVKVKDILRWKSFRDLVEEKSTPLDSCYSPYRCNTTSSNKNSDEDYLPWWCGEFENGTKKVGTKNLREEGVGTPRASRRGPKEELCFDENEQHSPVSVLESPFHEDNEEEIAFSFHRSLANIETRKSMLMQRIQHFESLVEEDNYTKEELEEDDDDEEIQEKAKQLLSHLKETNNFIVEDNYEGNYVDELLLDFFWDEMSKNKKLQSNNNDNGVDEKLMREAKSCMNGEYIGEFEWEMEDKREAYIKDMERVANWNNFEEDKQELSLDLESQVFNDLIHEVLEDSFSS